MHRGMRSRSSPAVWMGLAFGAALGLAALVLAARGAGPGGTLVALQMTARLSFLLFWPAYAGSALYALFGATFEPLKRRGREFGLAFASAHLVHIALVAWLSYIGAAPPIGSFIFFGIAVVCTYLLVLFSIASLRNALGRRGWWALRTIALNYIAFAFAVDFLRYRDFTSAKFWIAYVPFDVLAVAGPLACFAAFLLWAVRYAERLYRTSRLGDAGDAGASQQR
jgi:hypothetical protein